MFNILVNTEYEWLFETLKAEAPEFFSLKLADFSCPDENQYKQLAGTDAIIGQKINLSDAQYEAAGKLFILVFVRTGKISQFQRKKFRRLCL